MPGSDEIPWLNRLDREMDSLRLAHEWAISRGDVEREWRLVAALAQFWVLRGYLREGTQWVEAALSRTYTPDWALRARFLKGAGLLAHWSGSSELAISHYEGSLAAAKATQDSITAAPVLGLMGTALYAQGSVARARILIAEMLTLARAADAGLLIGYAFVHRVLFAIGPHGSQRERELLRSELDEPVERLRLAGERRTLATLLACRARLLVDVDAAAAQTALQEALTLGRGVDAPLMCSMLPWLAMVLLAERLPAEQLARLAGGMAALTALGSTVGGRTAIDVFGAPQDRAALAQAVTRARKTLGEEAFAHEEAAGRAFSFDELLEALLAALAEEGALSAGTRTGCPSSSLISPREREVLALLVHGRSNKAIAETLFVAPSTVKTHVSSLLTKLDADNRAGLATIAMQRRLLAD
jgi:DNA-binding CsgD family transcriptional regulator